MTLQSTVASIQNIRKQRQLELELVELDRQWHLELKALARERLTLLKDLCKFQQDQRGAEHFPHTVHGTALRHLTDTAQARLHRLKEAKQFRKFDFQPDPVEKMHLQLPLLPPLDGAMEVRTAKDLYNHQVQVQKVTFEQCVADPPQPRRPFWDKALLGNRKKSGPSADRLGSFQHRLRTLPESEEDLQEARLSGEQEIIRRRRERLSKSPSLPALNRLRPLDSLKPSTIHPSLSNRHSASLDYLPVIKDAVRGQPGLATAMKATSVSSVTTLPTIDES